MREIQRDRNSNRERERWIEKEKERDRDREREIVERELPRSSQDRVTVLNENYKEIW